MHNLMKLIGFFFLSFIIGCTHVHHDNFREISSSKNLFSDDVVWYSGSFDPPTIGHIKIAEEVASRTTGPVYISINHNTGKNFNASIRERIEMLSTAFKDNPRVHIIREPSEGRRAFVEEVSRRHNRKVVLAVGEDVLKKNYEMLGDMKDLDFLSFERPGQESDYIPSNVSRVFSDQLDGIEGISSTVVRNAIRDDLPLDGLLTDEVKGYIRSNNLYRNNSYNQSSLLETFETIVRNHLPHLNIETVVNFEFKDIQSKGGQIDAMIRWIIENTEVPDKYKGFYTVFLESLMGERLLPLSVASGLKVGVYTGSFDPMNKGSALAITASIKALGLDKIYIAPFLSSRKTASYSVNERASFINAIIDELPEELKSKVMVIPAIDLNTSIDYLEAVSRFEQTKPIAIYGEDAIERNFKMLSGEIDLEYAVIRRSQEVSPYLSSLIEKNHIKEAHVFATGIVDIQSSTSSGLTSVSDLPPSVRK
ncbi:hypothetical protein OAT67_02785, partial [Bacteriovoracaceae bacterium]|nr:hypothetical protein [Bacteriovoracaceae bacterium]